MMRAACRPDICMMHQASFGVGPRALGRVRLSALIVTVAALAACSEPESVATTDGDDSPRGQSDAGSGGATDEPVLLDAPEDESELRAFLDAGSYRNWAKESEFHPSTGPHGGSVRTYYSPKAAAALMAGAAVFPEGAAAIKEAANDAGVYGQSVWIKVQAASDAGRGFFWFERFQRDDGSEDVYGNARGSAQCVGCHSLGHDYDRSTLPFE
jgi:hypothetical protein